ncbi:MAG: dTDP-glucose 4,6-dehydratase [Planctomycetota bacterium]
MPKILVTGGCGFVGCNLIRMILQDRPDTAVRNLDALTYSGRQINVAEFSGDPRYEFRRGDVADLRACREAVEGCDAVLHLAAESHVDRSIQDPRPFAISNTLGTQTLLEAWRTGPSRHGGRFVHVSTDEVYGDLPLGGGVAPFTEDSPRRPRSAYAASKAGAEHFADAYHETFGLNVVQTRGCNNLGPYQFPEKLVPVLITRAMRGERLPLYGDGEHVRDWMHVDDHCRGILAALDRGASGRTYNLGAGQERSNLEVARAILDTLGQSEDLIKHVADRPGHDRRYALDSTRARDELGWEPSDSAWPTALHRTVRWYKDNQAWTDSVLAPSPETREP